jgi:Na+/H+-dicarboxylate symporter
MNIAVKAGSLMLLFWAIGLAAFFAMQLAFPEMESASFFSTTSLHQAEDIGVIDMFIPSNPFHPLSEGLLPAIVIFSICLGFRHLHHHSRGCGDPHHGALSVTSGLKIEKEYGEIDRKYDYWILGKNVE